MPLGVLAGPWACTPAGGSTRRWPPEAYVVGTPERQFESTMRTSRVSKEKRHFSIFSTNAYTTHTTHTHTQRAYDRMKNESLLISYES